MRKYGNQCFSMSLIHRASIHLRQKTCNRILIALYCLTKYKKAPDLSGKIHFLTQNALTDQRLRPGQEPVIYDQMPNTAGYTIFDPAYNKSTRVRPYSMSGKSKGRWEIETLVTC